MDRTEPARRNTIPALFQGMRPKQWVKNLFVFAGLVFTGNIANLPLLGITLAAFAAFCAVASGLYLINDVRDRNEDRFHPTKKNRPIASGRLTPGFALGASAVLILGALALAWAINPPFFAIVILYLILTMAYTAGLKNVVILDLLLLASGFVIRAAAGALAIQVAISPWLLICTTLVALFLGLGKRRHELVLLSEGAGKHRRALEDYTLPFIDQMLSVVTAATLVAYMLYAFNSQTAKEHDWMLLTTPFVVYGLFRYLYLIHVKREGGSPENALLDDRATLINFALWTLTVLAIFKWGH
ncbi:MAG: decaprenyl-phosphate phosphoribosyltransferase [Armatimonadetes bacterium]|nr:decaprenyl-phosphate phosphoribosyltransferase [Armatimonadota bacterium]